MGRFWALLGPQGPHESTGATPRPPRSPPEAPGALSDNLGFWPPGGSPSTAPKPIKTAIPSLRHPSRWLRAAFLIQIAIKNASGSFLGPHFMLFWLGSRTLDFGSWAPGPQARGVGSCVPRRGAFSGQKGTLGRWGVQSSRCRLVRSSQGRFFPPKMDPGPQARDVGSGVPRRGVFFPAPNPFFAPTDAFPMRI